MHKNTKLTPIRRKEIYVLWLSGRMISDLALTFRVTRPIIYRVLLRARHGDFSVHRSTNHRYRSFRYGIKYVNNAESKVLNRLNKYVQRYEKEYPGELIHMDTKTLRRTQHESSRLFGSECLYVAIDDYSRYLFADILPKKNMEYATIFLKTFLKNSEFPIECIYTDNGTEFKGRIDHHFMAACQRAGLRQKFTRPRRPQTNGKAERVIRTLLEECLMKDYWKRTERRKALHDYINYYNMLRPHSALKQGKNLLTPCQKIKTYLNPFLYTTR